MRPVEPFLHQPRIAYFSMEIAMQAEIPTYSGGLGVLAGDTLRTAADLELPLVGVTLISRMGYFRQELTPEGQQLEHADPWAPEKWATPLEAKVAVPIGERMVWVQAWLHVLTGGTGYAVPVVLLDTDLPDNNLPDRTITHYLYGNGDEYRLKQEIVLGIGGARMLQALGFHIHTYHMNEGHSALLALELLRRFERSADTIVPGESIYDVPEVRERCLFTTHTPVEAGHDQFPYDMVHALLDDLVDMGELRQLAGAERLNMTRLALNLSGYVNGVAKRHAETSTALFPGHRVHAITNGVHPPTWTAPSFAHLYDMRLPEWRHEAEILLRADQLPDGEIWTAHVAAKQALIDAVKQTTDIELSPQLPIIGFGRRMTAYKRPTLLFEDLERLRRIAAEHPFQIVAAGKAHPNDGAGKALIEQLHECMRALQGTVSCAFLPNYGMTIARLLTSGSDMWLNTPLRPLEASGTSGMKAALNGVPHISVLDGWWLEGWMEGITGWAIGGEDSPGDTGATDATALYDKLEHTILPLFHGDRVGWLQVMKGTIAKNAPYFNSHRMMRRYAADAYIR